MLPVEQTQVLEALTPALVDKSEDVRMHALKCLVDFGPPGLARVIDVLEESNCSGLCKRDAAHTVGQAFSEGKIEDAVLVRRAVKALENLLSQDEHCPYAVDALGEIGPHAVTVKARLLQLLDMKKGDNFSTVKIARTLLKISPINH